jgi:predicted ATPase
MITELQLADLSHSSMFAYAADVVFIKKSKGLAFQPGLNILFGPNGCGKSTLLRMLAIATASEQGGVSTVTNDWINAVAVKEVRNGSASGALEGITVLHDGQPVMYGNPRNTVGLICGGAAFDHDFTSEGLANIQSKASTGYTTMNRLGRMLAVCQREHPFPTEIDRRVKKAGPRDWNFATSTSAEKLLVPSIPKGQQTLIFDEPESGLGIPAQRNVFNLLHSAARNHGFQIIVATHSVFALGLPGVNYIEMQDDYIAQSESCLEMAHLMLEMRKLLADRESSPPAADVGKNTPEAGTDKPVTGPKTKKPRAKKSTAD